MRKITRAGLKICSDKALARPTTVLSLQLYYVYGIGVHCSGVKIPSGPMKDAEGKTESNSVSLEE